jgi:hypothetical protein
VYRCSRRKDLTKDRAAATDLARNVTERPVGATGNRDSVLGRNVTEKTLGEATERVATERPSGRAEYFGL